MSAQNNPKPGVLFQQQPSRSSDVTKNRRPRTQSTSKNVPKAGTKKSLVRNTEMAIYPTKYKTDTPPEVEKKAAIATSSSAESYKTNLSAPNLNSALRIVKEMQDAAKAKPSKLQCTKLIDNEKVLRKVNFPYEEHLYHDLVALNVSDSTVPSGDSTSRPSFKFRSRERDREPELSQFFTPSFSPEYRNHSELPVCPMNPLRNGEEFSIYHRLRTWDVCD